MNFFGLFRRAAGPRPLVPAPDRPALPGPAAAPDDAAPRPPPDHVRRLLFDAVAAGDERRLEDLCREHQDLILRSGPAWLEVPEAFRASPEAYEWYGNGLRAVARFCADRVGHPHHEHHDAQRGYTLRALDEVPDPASPAH